MKYAVIYARYSSDRQNDMSIDGQIALPSGMNPLFLASHPFFKINLY